MMWLAVVGILYWCTVLFAAGAFFIIEMRDGDRPVGPWEWYQRLVALVVVAVGWPMVLLLGWRTSRVVPLHGKLTEDPEPWSPGPATVMHQNPQGPGYHRGWDFALRERWEFSPPCACRWDNPQLKGNPVVVCVGHAHAMELDGLHPVLGDGEMYFTSKDFPDGDRYPQKKYNPHQHGEGI